MHSMCGGTAQHRMLPWRPAPSIDIVHVLPRSLSDAASAPAKPCAMRRGLATAAQRLCAARVSGLVRDMAWHVPAARQPPRPRVHAAPPF